MSNIEEQLHTLIDGSGEDVVPQSRAEVILNTAIEGTGDYPDPQNTFEDLLIQALEVGGGGGVSKEYVDEQNRLQNIEIDAMKEKVKDLELFKFPNVTIVGEPTINHGQISDFSSTSYLKFPFLVDFRNQNFEINMCFTTGENVTNQENIFDSDYGLAFAIRNGKFVIAISTNGTSWDLGEGVGTLAVQPKTTYYIRLSWNKLQYKLEYSLDNRTFTTDITKVATVQPYPKQVFIGVGENFTSILNHFTGSINLNNATLKIGNEVVWSGMDDAGLSTRADISLSNIDADGEAKIRSVMPIVILTQEEYDDLPEKLPDVLYFIKES